MTERMNECVQAGPWGLDDIGLEYMPNRDVAEHVQQKVLKMYISVLLLATVSRNCDCQRQDKAVAFWLIGQSLSRGARSK